ncbi:unnamed protein product [Didymodactylos carnosus]|uniref:Uncharacterized protein n=1 Tax=Didymodactylos carnosus TaxID=1234261 RepID=A0A813YKZ4_9BILA|nr:unnamed protein product [Didymodactylos carnosus]CAF3670926.1 unnamed protein product [Didymodactylos carnosus]
MAQQSLAEQLQNIKLKPSKDKTKDFSDPKLAGFTTTSEIETYQNNALKANIEEWQTILQNETFPTSYCPISYEDATYFLEIYDVYFKNLQPEHIWERLLNWRQNFTDKSSNKLDWLNGICLRLDNSVNEFKQSFTNGLFVKTSSRSAKDAPVYQKKFMDSYKQELSKYSVEEQKIENNQIICLLTAAFNGLKVNNVDDILNQFVCSERIYQDMLLATEAYDRRKSVDVNLEFRENFVLRPFIQIDVDMEYRGFVYDYKLTALSQYNYLLYSKRLNENKEKIEKFILQYYITRVKPKLESNNYLKHFIIDFALCEKKNIDKNIENGE